MYDLKRRRARRFSSWFSAAMERRNLLIGDVAERLGVRPSHAAGWMENDIPSAGEVVKLADLMGADRAWLLKLGGYDPDTSA